MMSELAAISQLLRVTIDARGTQGFARSLVGALSPGLGAQAALLYQLDRSGNLLLRDSYGFSGDITQAFLSPHLFDDLPMGDAIRQSTTVILSRAEVLGTVSRVNEDDLLFDNYVHIPCRSLDTPVGGICLAFPGESSDPYLSEPVRNALGTIGAARLNQLSLARQDAA